MLKGKLYITFSLLFLSSCAIHSVENRVKYADALSNKNSLEKKVIKTENFYLLTYSKISDPKSALHVYIEGDGFAWRNRYTISENPTPKNPVALELAIVDPNPNIVYMARPCQYVDLGMDKMCQDKFWTGSRFAKSVIDSTNEVVSKFVQENQFKQVDLFGYSGGAAVAVLVASMRDDVGLIGTVAGNLNHKKLMKLHEVSPLDDSLDAIDVIEKVKDIPQFHLVGAKDRSVPPEIVISFVKSVNLIGGKAKFKIVGGAGHQYEKWGEVWGGVLEDNK
jgi:hypothetical protein